MRDARKEESEGREETQGSKIWEAQRAFEARILTVSNAA